MARESNRPRTPFTATPSAAGLPLSAIPESLVESQLFGHERDSFGGTELRHENCFERAQGGTLLLDEITEMRRNVQAELLSVLEKEEAKSPSLGQEHGEIDRCTPAHRVQWFVGPGRARRPSIFLSYLPSITSRRSSEQFTQRRLQPLLWLWQNRKRTPMEKSP